MFSLTSCTILQKKNVKNTFIKYYGVLKFDFNTFSL